jgi:chemotaxis regulatin CheY-phosphate phosphatase CheZ
LLHDQVSLQAADTTPASADQSIDQGGERGHAKRALEQRWHDLMIREVEFRSLPRRPAATG